MPLTVSSVLCVAWQPFLFSIATQTILHVSYNSLSKTKNVDIDNKKFEILGLILYWKWMQISLINMFLILLIRV